MSMPVSPGYGGTLVSLPGADAFHLSGETLLTYLQVELGALDDEIAAYLQRQTNALKQKEVLAKVDTALGKYDPPKNPEQWNEIKRDVDAALAELPESDPLRPQVNDAMSRIEERYLKKPNPVAAKTRVAPHLLNKSLVKAAESAAERGVKAFQPSKDQWKYELSNVEKLRESLQGNVELGMIQLQQLMSSRQTAVQLATNIMGKLNQSHEAIVRNI
jgi:hypothetical protein